MTVSELIEALQKMPQNLKVWYSTMYDADEVCRATKVSGREVYGADSDTEVVHLTYW